MSSFIDGLCRVSDSVSVDVHNGRASGRRVSGAKVKDDEFITYAERSRQRARSEAAARRAFYALLRDEAVRAAWEDYYIDNKSRIDLLSWVRTLEELERVAKGSTVSDSRSTGHRVSAVVKDSVDSRVVWDAYKSWMDATAGVWASSEALASSLLSYVADAFPDSFADVVISLIYDTPIGSDSDLVALRDSLLNRLEASEVSDSASRVRSASRRER